MLIKAFIRCKRTSNERHFHLKTKMVTSGEICPPKKCVRHGVHYQMELNFLSEADKKNFLRQLELGKSVMSSKES